VCRIIIDYPLVWSCTRQMVRTSILLTRCLVMSQYHRLAPLSLSIVAYYLLWGESLAEGVDRPEVCAPASESSRRQPKNGDQNLHQDVERP
jgi:hypothetical protein